MNAKNKDEKYIQACDFLNLAFKDYLAARVLIVNRLLLQGAILASTSVEKYIKALIWLRGNRLEGHLKTAHLNSLKNKYPALAQVLNHDFLQLLNKAYNLRYLDEVKKNFNLVIADREFLAELDFTVAAIQKGLRVSRDGKPAKLEYDQAIQERDPRLLTSNFLFDNVEKQSFVSKEPQVVYEIRKCPVGGLREVIYLTKPSISDANFLREGFTPQRPDGTQYKVSLEFLETLQCNQNGFVLDQVSR